MTQQPGVPYALALPSFPSPTGAAGNGLGVQHTARPTAQAGCAGRESELAKLEEAFREAQSAGERFVFVEGPGGIGKSKLLGELRGRVRLAGGVVLEGRCEPGRAFGPFAEIVDRALRFLDEVGVAPSAASLPGADGGLSCRNGCHRLWHQHQGDDGEESREPDHGAPPEIAAFEKRLRFFDAIHSLLRDVARVRPPLVLLHNLERADRGTLELLHFVLDGGGTWSPSESGVGTSMRALVVASRRNDVAPESPDEIAALEGHAATTRMTLGALDARGVRAYLQTDEAIARILARTGGHPDRIDLLLEADPLTPAARIQRRLDALHATARSIVHALAVLGRAASLDELAAVAGLTPELAARADVAPCELLTRSILDGDVLLAFERDTDRELCYGLVADSTRREMHARAVDVCAARLELEGAVRHAIATGDVERASGLAVAAAASLSARHAHAEAASLLESLAGATDGEVPRVIREELADLYRVTGDYRAALRHAEAVRAQTPDDPVAARRVGTLLTLAGDSQRAVNELESARTLAQAKDRPSEVAEVEAQLAEVHYSRASYALAREWAERALAGARASSSLRIEIHARNTLGKLALAQRDPATAAALFDENRAKAAHVGLGHQEAQAHTNLGVARLLQRDLAAAEAACRRAIEVATRASDTRDRAIATENLAVVAHLARDYRRALTHYHSAVGLLKRLGNRAMLARVASNLGELYVSLGDWGRAQGLCDLAWHVGGPGASSPVDGERWRLRGRVEAGMGNHAHAREAFNQALTIFTALGDQRITADVSLELARLAVADGDVSRARSLLAALPVQDTPRRAAEVAIVAADIERAAGGETLTVARRAVELAEKAQDDELMLPALARYARALGDAGDLALAVRVLERAQAVDQALTQNVPEEALAVWLERPARSDLLSIAARLASAWTASRHDSVPPPRAFSANRGAPRPETPAQGIVRPVKADVRFERWAKKYPAIAGTSQAVATVLSVIDKVANSDATVLVRGESGTGKELVAEGIHQSSSRASKPLVKVNCAALVETLLLSELFGHERGAFTGAQARKKGRFELADGGTLFLDEIGDISAKTQVALLRVLQEREFERVGGTQAIRVDVRIVAATHRDLEKMVREGTFREDLYYRLRGVTVEMPPLRRRLEDLPILCDRLLVRIAEERGEPKKSISRGAVDLLMGHRWPGNVRELENVLRSATLFAEGDELLPADFAAFAESFDIRVGEGADTAKMVPMSTTTEGRTTGGDVVAVDAAGLPIESLVYERVRGGSTSLFEMKKILERECIVRALEETNGNITRAAALLGMKRPRLSQLVKEYELGDLGK